MINGVNSSLQPDRNQKEDSARTAKDEDHPHVHFSPRPTIRRLPSQTKAWTDQAAPEPFSTPRQRKLGYGDYLSRKETCNSGNDGGVNRVAYPNSHHDKSSYSNTVFRRSKSHDVAAANINGMHMATKQRGNSCAQHDFPSLSPIKPQLKPSRTTSWSSVARNVISRSVQKMEEIQRTEEAYTTLNMIPPPPLSEVQSPPFIKPQVSFRNEPDNIQLCNSLVETLQETELSQSFPPSLHETLYESKQHLRSSSFSSATYHCPEYSPFDTFTTMSRSCLQNDIGTLLARYNRIEEAIERFEHSIEVATVDRDGLMVALEHLSASSEVTSESIIHPEPKSKCPKVTEAEGLAWFHQKLLKGDVAAAPLPANTSSNSHNHSRNQSNSQYPFQPAGFGGLAPMSATTRRIRSASFGVDTMSTLTSRSVDHDTSTEESYMPSHPLTAPYPAKSTVIFGDVKDNSHTNSTRQPFSTKPPKERHSLKPFAVLDDMEIYSCNGLTPLGLEYIVDPLPVLGSRLRKLVAECLAEDELEDFGILPNICEASATKRRKRMIAALLMDSAALIASKINMAGLRYKRGYDLNELLSILQHALDDFASVRKVIDNDPLNNELLCRDSFMDVFGLLEIVGHLNLGVLLYRLNKIRDAMTSFESARDKLELKKNLDNKTHGISCTHTLLNNEQHPHDDNRLPSSEYLLLAIQVSTARAFLRLNDPDNAEKICQSIAEENKPHRRNSSRLHHRAISSHSFGGGYARSDSFSLTTSAVNTALAAYQFNIDRRYNWLLLVAENYLNGLKHETRGEVEDYQCAVTYYNRILSETRKKFDHRHPFVCSILERRGEVLFEQRKLQCSMLSYLACLKIIEHQQLTKSVSYREEEMARILYSVARVLHDKEDYHDAIGMYQRALVCQRSLAGDKPSLNVITTLCNISRVHHLCGEIDEALATNKEVLILATKLVGGKMDHPFLIHRLKVEGNILIEAGRIEDAMTTFIDAARRCCKDGQNRMITTLMGAGENSREDADAGDSSVLSMRSAAALAHIAFLHPA